MKEDERLYKEGQKLLTFIKKKYDLDSVILVGISNKEGIDHTTAYGVSSLGRMGKHMSALLRNVADKTEKTVGKDDDTEIITVDQASRVVTEDWKGDTLNNATNN